MTERRKTEKERIRNLADQMSTLGESQEIASEEIQPSAQEEQTSYSTLSETLKKRHEASKEIVKNIE